MQPTTSAPGLWPRVWAVLRQRCPRCRTGPVFRSVFRMNDPCPHCGLVFEREEGYFLGAMYISYVLGCAVVSVGYFVGTWLWPALHPVKLCLLLFAAYVPLMPLIYRYSRVLWMHLDRAVSPSDIDAGAYEKLREQRRARPG